MYSYKCVYFDRIRIDRISNLHLISSLTQLIFRILLFLDKKTKAKFKRRTLVDEIKSILQQYPDDGQIFKVREALF